MKIRLLEPHGNYPAGRVWDCPWSHIALLFIRQGKALAIEACDQHLNPKPEPIAEKPQATSRRRGR